MVQIRKGVFETNSSSTHSLVMCSETEYDDWANGKTYYVEWLYGDLKDQLKDAVKGSFIAKEAVDALGLDEDERREYFKTNEEFFDNEYLESFEDSYTTASGEKVIAFGLYGYDG